MSRDRWTAVLLVAIYLAARLGWAAAGATIYGLDTDGSWQLLPGETLKFDLLRGLLVMHSQPPLYNLMWGLVNKTPWPEAAASTLLAVAAVAILLSLFALLRRLDLPRTPAAVAALGFVLYPSFTIYDHTFMYTPFEIALVQGAGVSLFVAGRRAIEDRSTTGPLIAFGVCVSGLVLIRPFYHPLWVTTAALAAMWGFRRMRVPITGRVVFCLMGPLLVSAAIMTKNYWLVGQPVTGTWTGMHLSRLVQRWSNPERVRALQEAGVLSPLAVYASFQPLDTYASVRDAYLPRVPVPAVTHPALTVPMKTDSRWPNFNDVEYIAIASVKLGDSLAYIRHYPGDYLPGVLHNIGAITSSASYASQAGQVADVMAKPVLWTHTPNGRWFVRVPMIVMIVLTLSVVVRRLWQARNTDRSGDAPGLAFILVTMVYVIGLSVAMEVDELPRYRMPLDPWLYAISVSTIFHAINRRQ